jgi:hypothetical protein
MIRTSELTHSQVSQILLRPNRREEFNIRLRRGEIAIVRCGRLRFRPRIVGLQRGEMVRIRCGNSSANITCGRGSGSTRTIRLNRGESIILVCRRRRRGGRGRLLESGGANSVVNNF